jgi:hypothetical protein
MKTWTIDIIDFSYLSTCLLPGHRIKKVRNDVSEMHSILTLHVSMLLLISLSLSNCSPAGTRAKKGEKCENSWRDTN